MDNFSYKLSVKREKYKRFHQKNYNFFQTYIFNEI